MKIAWPIAVLLALAGCNNAGDDTIDAVPEPSAASASNLMAQAERAADNAQSRLTEPNNVSSNKGEAR